MRRDSYHSENMKGKPSILGAIGHRVELRRAGRDWRGLCPFHSEKTPSFTVNDDKGFYHCFGCQEHGDVIDFIQKFDGVSFRDALLRLGISSGEYKPKPIDPRKRRAAAMVADWMNEQHVKVGAVLRDLTRCLVKAEEIRASTLIELWQREFDRLEILFDILQEPAFAAGLWGARDSIEAITAQAPVEAIPEFPPWTAEYAAYLRAHLPAPEAVA